MTSDTESRTLRDSLPQFLPALRSYARALCREASAADDLVQETILRALGAEDQWRADSNLRAWLFTIQRNAWPAPPRGGEALHGSGRQRTQRFAARPWLGP